MKYSEELEFELYRWYKAGEDADPKDVLFKVFEGVICGESLSVGIETPETFLRAIGSIESLREGEEVTLGEDVGISFKHLVMNEAGEYFVPLFTRPEEMEKGPMTMSMLPQPLKELFGHIDSWPKCLGFVINPWDRNLTLHRERISGMMAMVRKMEGRENKR